MEPVLLSDVCFRYFRSYSIKTGIHHFALILRELIDRDVVTTDHLLNAVYPIDSDKEFPEDMRAVIRTRITLLRKWLKPGWTIVNINHHRWQLMYEPPSGYYQHCYNMLENKRVKERGTVYNETT